MSVIEQIIQFTVEYKWVLLFYVAIVLLVFLNRKKFDVQGIIALYRTKVGLKLMNKIADKHREWVKILGYVGIGAGYIGLIAITLFLTKNIWDLLFVPGTASAVSPVFPGFPVPGTGGYKIPLISGWIALFLVVLIHEFSHGVVAAAHKLKIKSSGLFFFGPLMGAFVEPQESYAEEVTEYYLKKLGKVPIEVQRRILGVVAEFIRANKEKEVLVIDDIRLEIRKSEVQKVIKKFKDKGNIALTDTDDTVQYSVYAAGPFSNVITAGVVLLFMMFLMVPIGNVLASPSGFELINVTSDFPADKSGLVEGHVITSINGAPVVSTDSFISNAIYLRPGETVNVTANGTVYNVETTLNPTNNRTAYFGFVGVDHETLNNPSLSWLYSVFIWIEELFTVLFILSLGIGLVNLFPIFVTDGARMLQLTLMRLYPEKGLKIWKNANIICLFILLAGLALPFFKWLFGLV